MPDTISELLMQPGTPQTFKFGELAFRTVVPSAFSSAISLFEAELAPGTLSGPLHIHDREAAVSYVLEGSLTFQVGDEILDASAGTAVVQPRGVQHTFWNASARPARALDIVIPGGLERFYEDVAATIKGEPDALEHLATMEERFGIRMDWSSLPILLERHNLRPAAS